MSIGFLIWACFCLLFGSAEFSFVPLVCMLPCCVELVVEVKHVGVFRESDNLMV